LDLIHKKMFANKLRISAVGLVPVTLVWMTACWCHLFLAPMLMAQVMDDSLVAKHVHIRIPVERHWLGRDSISDLERSWEFIQAAAGRRLPSRVLIVIEWRDDTASVDSENSTISIGMSDPAAAPDMKGFLIHNATRELARLALINLSGNGAAREENRFLLEGMSEMLAHEFSHSVKRLGAAWAICYYLDRMNHLGLKQLSGRPELSGSNHDLRSAAAGITLLTVCRELYGQERVLKLFESLARKNVEQSLAAAFKTPAAVEAEWLNRVRSYQPADVSITTEEEAPVLDRVIFVPDRGKPGATLAMQLFTHDRSDDLSPAGIFVIDESSGKVLQGREARAADGQCTQFEIPIDSACQEGRYRLRIVAIDEGGNVRNWEASYSVVR
jgi:hypothetical protein